MEVSVFGPGVGECIVAHLGDGDWIVVDSCIDKQTGRPIALDYLQSLGVDVASQVKLVVATHWHDDHIGGLASILRVAKSAKFVDSAAYMLEQLVQIVLLGAETPGPSSATIQYKEIIEILKERRDAGERAAAVGPVRASANKKLLALTGIGRSVEAEVVALSPSDGVLNHTRNYAAAELSRARSVILDRRRPALQGPNQLSVALWLKVGALDVLLGADLEHVPGTTEGWQAIIASAERPTGRSGFFKVPHHGSENADCPDCWATLLLEEPIAVLTAYTRSNLPRPMDIARLRARTKLVFLTSGPAGYGMTRRPNAVEKTLRQFGVKPRALTGQMGHIQVRSDALDITSEPVIVLRNGARQCA